MVPGTQSIACNLEFGVLVVEGLRPGQRASGEDFIPCTGPYSPLHPVGCKAYLKSSEGE